MALHKPLVLINGIYQQLDDANVLRVAQINLPDISTLPVSPNVGDIVNVSEDLFRNRTAGWFQLIEAPAAGAAAHTAPFINIAGTARENKTVIDKLFDQFGDLPVVGSPVSGDYVIIFDSGNSYAVSVAPFSAFSGGAGGSSRVTVPKSIPWPVVGDNIWLGYAPVDITIARMVAVLQGSSSPSVSWTMKFASDRSATGTAVVTAGTTTTNTTTGDVITSMDDPIIPASNHMWLSITAVSGVVSELGFSYDYTDD